MGRFSTIAKYDVALEDLDLLGLRFGAFLDADGKESVFELRRELGRT